MPRRFRLAIRRSPKSDPQQYRVYRMENESIGARHYMRLDPEVIRQLVRAVCRNYRVPQPILRWQPLGRWAAEWSLDEAGQTFITFNPHRRTSRDALTVTHELAHHIHYHLSDGAADRQEPHGPEFMACHMSILDTCRMIPVVGMRAICDSYRVRYCDPGTTNSLRKLQRICRKAA